jgi:hypothetical protein
MSSSTSSRLILAFVGSLALQTAAFAQEQAPQAAQGTGGEDTANPFVAHAQEAGLSRCEAVLPVLGDILTAGTTYDVQTQWDQERPDERSVQSLVGIDYQGSDSAGAGAGIVFAMPSAQGCDGVAVRVVPLPESCEEAPRGLQPGSTLRGTLRGTPVYDLPEQTGQVMLIGQGEGCVAVTVVNASARP